TLAHPRGLSVPRSSGGHASCENLSSRIFRKTTATGLVISSFAKQRQKKVLRNFVSEGEQGRTAPPRVGVRQRWRGSRRRLMKQLTSLRATLAGLEPAKLAGLAGAIWAVRALVGGIPPRSAEPMGLLYSGLDPAEAGRIGQRLDELKVP